MILVTTTIGRKAPGIEAVVEDDNANCMLRVVLPRRASVCEGALSHKMLLDPWEVSIGNPTFWNQASGSHFRYSQCQGILSSAAASLLDYAEDTIAWLGVRKSRQ